MTGKEMKQIIDEFRAEGKTDEEILDGAYYLFKIGDFNIDDLKVIAAFVGYELDENFLKMDLESQKHFDEDVYDETKYYNKDNKIAILEEKFVIDFNYSYRLRKAITGLAYDLIIFKKGDFKNPDKPLFFVDLGSEFVPMYLDYFKLEIIDEYKDKGLNTFDGIDDVKEYVKNHFIAFNNYLYTLFNPRLIDFNLSNGIFRDDLNLIKEYKKALEKKYYTLSDLLDINLTIKEEIELLEMLATSDTHTDTLIECIDSINSLKYTLGEMTHFLACKNYNRDFFREYIMRKRNKKEI